MAMLVYGDKQLFDWRFDSPQPFPQRFRHVQGIDQRLIGIAGGSLDEHLEHHRPLGLAPHGPLGAQQIVPLEHREIAHLVPVHYHNPIAAFLPRRHADLRIGPVRGRHRPRSLVQQGETVRVVAIERIVIQPDGRAVVQAQEQGQLALVAIRIRPRQRRVRPGNS